MEGAVERILADEHLLWFPIKHFSPACAWHLKRLIHDVRPAAVLVEGPDDADGLIPHIVAPETRPPLTTAMVSAFRIVDSRWLGEENRQGARAGRHGGSGGFMLRS